MKSRKNSVLKNINTTLRSFAALVLVTALFTSALSFSATADNKSNAKKLTEDQKILHVLNRLGFGPMPGDIEKVKAIGIDKYIEQQLYPDKIADNAVNAKLQNLSALKMSTEELFGKYPNPGALLRTLQQKGELPKNVSDAYKNQQENKANKKAGVEEQKDGEMQKPKNQQQGAMTEDEQRQARRQIDQYLRENGLKPPREMVAELYASRVLRATYSERQLNEVMVDFWTNHFNVFVGKNVMPWYLISYDRDTIRPNALGKFKDLLLATAKSPTMLVYLDNFESVSPNAQIGNGRGNANNNRLNRALQNGGQLNPQMRARIKQQTGMTDSQIDQRIEQMRKQQNQQPQQQRMKRGINENYAREIMELHTLGVDGGYTQKDIQEVARCFTGWTVADARGYRKAAANEIMGREPNKQRVGPFGGFDNIYDSGSFVFAGQLHDNGEKVVLGKKISAGGMNDGLAVIDILAKHPSTAKFIAKKLAVKFVNDNPSDALVNRVADAFTKSDGDIRATLKALFTSPEFFAPENYRAKIKTPFELTISAIRALGGETNGGPGINAMLAKMGEQLYGWQPPTGYPDQAEDWVNTGALLERLNFGLALASNRIPGTKVDLSKIAGGNITKTSNIDREKFLNQSIAFILNNEVSENTKSVLMKQIDQPLPEQQASLNDMPQMGNAGMQQDRTQRLGGGGQGRLLAASGNPEVVKIIGLVLGSPEFQRQ